MSEERRTLFWSIVTKWLRESNIHQVNIDNLKRVDLKQFIEPGFTDDELKQFGKHLKAFQLKIDNSLVHTERKFHKNLSKNPIKKAEQEAENKVLIPEILKLKTTKNTQINQEIILVEVKRRLKLHAESLEKLERSRNSEGITGISQTLKQISRVPPPEEKQAFTRKSALSRSPTQLDITNSSNQESENESGASSSFRLQLGSDSVRESESDSEFSDEERESKQGSDKLYC